MSLRIGDGWIHIYDRGALLRTDRECSMCHERKIWQLLESKYGCIGCGYIYQFETEEDVTEEEYEEYKELLALIRQVQSFKNNDPFSDE